MLKSKKKKIASIAVMAAAICLTACDDNVLLPIDYEETLFPGVPDDVDVWGNQKENYYYDVSSTDSIYEETVNQILLDIASIAHNYSGDKKTETGTGENVWSIIGDSYEGMSIGDSDDDDLTAVADDNLYERAKDSLASSAASSAYAKDNLFYEDLWVKELEENFTLPSDFLDQNYTLTDGLLITPDLEYEDIFGGNYDEYMEDELYENYQINYLTSEFIFNKTYSSIGNTNARNVQIAAITDLEDEPGSARKFLNAYIGDYVRGDGDYTGLVGTDTDFSILEKLWKGITKETVAGIVDKSAYMDDSGTLDQSAYDEAVQVYYDRYSSVILTDEEEAWLEHYGLITNDESYTNAGQIVEDQKDLEEGIEDLNKLDTSLESEYTGSYTYDYRTGVRKAIDSLATSTYVTDGIHLKSNGIDSLPSSLEDRLFSTDYETNKNDIAEMKEAGAQGKNAAYDITTYEPDGYRYLTVENTTADASVSNILYYDSDSSTYYLVRVLDVINSSVLGRCNDGVVTPSSTSVYDTQLKAETMARMIAYAMSTTGSYKSDSTIYWLRRTKIELSDEGFYDYLKSNYKDLYREESAYDGDPTIYLKNIVSL